MLFRSGSDVVVVPVAAKPDSPDHYVNTARRIAKETPNSLFVFQYGNPANPEAHYLTTGPELWSRPRDASLTSCQE